MDIDILKRKRQKNVQEQNALTKHYLRELAVDFKMSAGDYMWLSRVLIENGLSLTEGILVSLNSCIEQGLVEEFNAIWVTSDEIFYEIDIVLRFGTQEVIKVEGFKDITETVNVNAHQKGRGKSFGFLALELLRELK